MTSAKGKAVKARAAGRFVFALWAVLVGIVAGLGAALFRAMIAWVHNLSFLGIFSLDYNANTHTPGSPLGHFVILVPVAGALVVAFLVKTFAPEAKGHGVPEVMDAIYYNRGVIRPIVAAIKSLASAISIGTGGSVGREGPIIQIGSSFGSTLGQWLRLPAWQRITLIACGAGGGIAATFNTPVGGVLFVLEIMMHEVSVRTLVPVAIATATATYVGRLVFGPHASFVIPALETPYFHVTKPALLLAYAALGVLMGAVSALFIKSVYGFEDFFERHVKGGYYRQHLLGMFIVGLMIDALMVTAGHYYVEGVGYAAIQDVLAGAGLPIFFLILLFLLKLFATSLTLGSGASGGIFSPALFMGATLGGAFGGVLNWIFPHLSVSPPAFAVIGMAAMVGGSTAAAMSAITMIFEMTLDYSVIIPMTIAVMTSYGVRKMLSRESIYTMKLARRGHYLPDALQTGPHFLKRAHELMLTDFLPVDAGSTLREFASIATQHPRVSVFVVRREDRIAGFVQSQAALDAIAGDGGARPLGDVARQDYIVVAESAAFSDVISALRNRQATIAFVANEPSSGNVSGIKGVITKEQVANAMLDASEIFYD
ncbi:MAG TPA: chloride channel protein [Chthoniobacteraceae bacterium]|jgi:CIC family chloride channel protein|nr:chloride channel protein [Chthoniobacteraceae bacterium]